MDPNGAGSSHHPSQPYASVSGSTSHCETGGGGGYAKAHKRTSRRNQVTGRDERKERSDRFTVGIAPLEEYISSPKASALRHSIINIVASDIIGIGKWEEKSALPDSLPYVFSGVRSRGVGEE
ncbi:hypothetical protein GW17_00054016 [Ensete ventricosum]|nr:hypothetical protein GW17_00054016 [Ensete ventricosum]